MTPNEQAALVIEQRLSGEQNGKAIARIVTDRFKTGLSEHAPDIRKITADALDHVVKRLTENGVEAQYIEFFAEGFGFGLRTTFFEHANHNAARALRANHNG